MQKVPQNSEFYRRLFDLIDGEISDDDRKILEEAIRSDPQTLAAFVDFIGVTMGLREFSKSYKDLVCASEWGRGKEDTLLWQILAEYEKQAPAMEVRRVETSPPQRIEPAPAVSVRRINRASLLTAVLSFAALFFLIVYVSISPTQVPYETATLTDTINAQWIAPRPLETGQRLCTQGKPLTLRSGLACIAFDSGAKLTIEGPAEFSILTDDQIRLQYGKVYAAVPQNAIGFTVSTTNSKVIDLGTEFGVKADLDSETQVHVISGKTILISLSPNQPQKQYELCQGQAKAVTVSGEVHDIDLKSQAFVRLFNSEKKFIWKGKSAIDLADIVGGGDGFGAGQIGAGLDPLTGKPVDTITPRYSIRGSGRYQPATNSSFVDGVFVPDGGEGPIQVSSRGDRFENAPDTNGEFWTEITNGGQLSDPVELSPPQFRLQGREVGTAQSPAIFMHANAGITFDLHAIRQSLSGLRITEFRALAGISENGPRRAPYADFWVLVDGQPRCTLTGVDGVTVHSVTVEIRETDRFLTLMVTDGGEEVCLKVNGVPYVMDGDWGLFAAPRLVLTPEE